MENPFPGMDPWMEDQWGDAHASLIVFAREQLRGVLPEDLKARIEERVYVETDEEDDGPPGRTPRRPAPDLRVVERATVTTRPQRVDRPIVGTGVGVASPLIVKVGDDPVTETFIKIVDRRSGGRVVTMIEVLSPSNKRRGMGRERYLHKQDECLAAGVNLVEIDLLRGGQWAVYAPEFAVAGAGGVAYQASVWRASQPLDAEFYPIGLRERLPAIRIPLRAADPDVPLDLQPLVNQAYVSGEYDDTDYARQPVPPLTADDYAWATTVLKEKGLL